MEVTEGLHTFPSKGGVTVFRVLPSKDLSHWTGSVPGQQQTRFVFQPMVLAPGWASSRFAGKSLGMGGMEMGKVPPNGGICHLKGLLPHPLSTKVSKDMRRTLCQTFFIC